MKPMNDGGYGKTDNEGKSNNKASCFLCDDTGHKMKNCPYKDVAMLAVKLAKESEKEEQDQKNHWVACF